MLDLGKSLGDTTQPKIPLAMLCVDLKPPKGQPVTHNSLFGASHVLGIVHDD